MQGGEEVLFSPDGPARAQDYKAVPPVSRHGMGIDKDWVSLYADEVRRYESAVEKDHHGTMPETGRGSAVLAPLVATPAGVCLLLERRPDGPNPFAGHLSFPGGRIEPEDASPLAAALRESEEEVGFPPEVVDTLGLLVETSDPRMRPVSAFVGHVPLSAIPTEAASPEEVAELILVPLADLAAATATQLPYAEPVTPHLYRATGYDSRLHPRWGRTVHYWPLKEAGGDRKAMLWGFTAGLTALLLERTLDWSPPREPRMVTRHEEMFP